MKSFHLSALAAVVIGATAMPAHAIMFTVTRDQTSQVAGALKDNFDAGDTLNLRWTTGGMRGSTNIVRGNPGQGQVGYKCYGPASVGNYLCQQGGFSNAGWASFDFRSRPINYFGINWLTVDGYVGIQDQHVKVYGMDGKLLKVAGTKHPLGTMGARDVRPNVDLPSRSYINIFATGSERFSRVELFTNVRSFEVAELAIRYAGASAAGVSPMVAVPEASTYAMLAAGLGVVGFIARRRRPRA